MHAFKVVRSNQRDRVKVCSHKQFLGIVSFFLTLNSADILETQAHCE